MAIWSLTKERVERLQRQIGEKEVEIDTLIKLSKEDLWKRDLDDFINEWRFQIADEEKRQKKVANLGRRASVKVKTQIKPAARKRKANNDSPSDSDVSFEKPKKTAATKRAQPKTGLLSNLTGPAKPKQQTSILSSLTTVAKPATSVSEKAAGPVADAPEDVWMALDGAVDHDSDVPVVTKRKAKSAPAAKESAPVKRSKVISDNSDEEQQEEEVVRPAATSRTARTAARKPVKYTALESDTEDGDDMLFDVGKMVKGIGVNGASADPSASRPLFSATASVSRPSSSTGLVGRKPASKSNVLVDDEDDETDYTRLAPANAKTAKSTVLSDDEDDSFDLIGATRPASVPVAPVPKPKASAKPAAAKPAVVKKAAIPVAKPAPKEQAKKATALSPAAKAYAAKQARGTTGKLSKSTAVVDVDSDDDVDDFNHGDEVGKMVDDMLSEDDEDDIVAVGIKAAAGRPARRAAAQAAVKRQWVLEDEDDEDEESEDEGEEEGSFASEGSE